MQIFAIGGLCALWSSLLLVFAHRLIRDQRFYCRQSVLHNVPLLQWSSGQGCRALCVPTSLWGDGCLGAVGTVSFTLLVFSVSYPYFCGYFVLFSALLVSVRTDLETMLIARLVTLPLVPFAWVLSSVRMLPISMLDSIAGALLGYLSLFAVAYLFSLVSAREGIGEGDFELLAMIGAFVGVWGCWVTLTISSVVGSIVGLLYVVFGRKGRGAMLPYAPFLALGAVLFVLCASSNFFEPLFYGLMSV